MAPAFRSSARVAEILFAVSLIFFLSSLCRAQDQSQTSSAETAQDSGTSTDFYVMMGSDFVRPGLVPKANYNIGIGHTFGFLKKDPIGDELTFAYTYEDGGSGFWHSQFGSHTESFGVMKKLRIAQDEARQRLHVGSSGRQHLHGQCTDSESLLRRRITGRGGSHQ